MLGALGIVLFLALWQIIGHFRLAGLTWPPLTEVLRFLAEPSRRGLFERALGATISAAALGLGFGGLAGIAFAILAHVVPWLRPGADRTTAIVHSVPSIALGPLFIVLLSREATPAAIAGLNAFFVLYVSTSSGLASMTKAHQDVMAVLGASRWARLRHLDLPAALPSVASGMKLAVPACLIGTIIGEWFGAPRGLGLLIVNAMQNFQIPLLWSAVLLAAAASLACYGVLSLVERAAAEHFR
jgi:NitT/TauT family transport system permease protein